MWFGKWSTPSSPSLVYLETSPWLEVGNLPPVPAQLVSWSWRASKISQDIARNKRLSHVNSCQFNIDAGWQGCICADFGVQKCCYLIVVIVGRYCQVMWWDICFTCLNVFKLFPWEPSWRPQSVREELVPSSHAQALHTMHCLLSCQPFGCTTCCGSPLAGHGVSTAALPRNRLPRYYNKAVLDVKRISKVQSSPVTWRNKGDSQFIPNSNGCPSFSHDVPMIGQWLALFFSIGNWNCHHFPIEI